MAEPYLVTEIQTGREFSKYISYLKYKYTWNREPIGFKINNASSSPTVTRINRNGDDFNPDPDFFYNHELCLWPKCLLSETGVGIYGTNYIGSNLDITGASGDVMTYIPNGKYKYWYESDSDTQYYLYAPYDSNYRGFDYFPHCYAGGGTLRDHFFIGTYPAGLKNDNGTLKLNSCTGVQPWTGGEMYSRTFTSGSTEFTVGEILTGATSGAYATVVDFHKTSGEWATGDAAGTVYLRQKTGTFVSEDLNGSVSGANCVSIEGEAAALSFTLDNALTYASNKGAGWTISDIYSTSWIRGLLYTQWGTRDSQATVGNGIINLVSGTGYAGLLNGANNIDLNVDVHGTGKGDGVDGQTPIEVNNICDLWGGIWEYVTGINALTDGTYRVTKRDGTGQIAGVLPEGSYETNPGPIPAVDGYYTKVKTDPLGATIFIPNAVGGADSGTSKGFCDYMYKTMFSPSIMLSGGLWFNGLVAGVGSVAFSYAPSYSARYIGARLKYIPQS